MRSRPHTIRRRVVTNARTLGGKGVAGDDVLELGHGADVAGAQAVGRLGLFALVLEQLTDALLVTVAPDDHIGITLDGSLEDAEDVDAAAELVGHGLEHEGDRRLGDIAGKLHVGAVGAECPRRRDRVGRGSQSE